MTTVPRYNTEQAKTMYAGAGIVFKGEYKNSHFKNDLSCLACGFEWQGRFGKFLSGQGCDRCARKKQWQKLKERMFKIRHAQYSELGIKLISYDSTVKGATLCCMTCNNTWTATGASGKNRCRLCINKRMTRSQVEVEKFYDEKNIDVCSNYVKQDKQISLHCRTCDKKWEALFGKGCSKCQGEEKLSVEEVKAHYLAMKIELVSDYKSARKNVTLRCLVCEEVWTCIFSRETGCRVCNARGGVQEKKCREAMEQHFRVPFPKIKPHFLVNPSTGRRLELDGFNGDLKIAFEYQGEQHYLECSRGTEGNYGGLSTEHIEKVQERDRIKRKLCIENDLILIEIPYWVTDYTSFIQERMNALS